MGGGDVCDLHHCELFSAAKEGLVEFHLGRVRGIFRFDVTFNGDAIEWTPIDVFAQADIVCSIENIAETVSLVTLPKLPLGATASATASAAPARALFAGFGLGVLIRS